MISCKKNVLVQILFYWMGSEQEHRGPEHSLKSVTVKTGNSLQLLFGNPSLSLAVQSFLQPNNTCEKVLLMSKSVFLSFETAIPPIFCRLTVNFLTVSVFCLTLLLIVLRSCHFISTVTITLLLTHRHCKAMY